MHTGMGKKWNKQRIAPTLGTVEYTCQAGVAPDGKTLCNVVPILIGWMFQLLHYALLHSMTESGPRARSIRMQTANGLHGCRL